LASEGVATGTPPSAASAAPQPQRPPTARQRDPADTVRERVLRLAASLNSGGPRDGAPQLTDLGLTWDHCTAYRGEALGHRWAVFVADEAGAWREPQPTPAASSAPTANPDHKPVHWCCIVWPVRSAPRARAWFANHEGAVWESAVPAAVDLGTWHPDPSVIAPSTRSATSYLRRASGAGFVWSAINVLPSAPR